MELNNIENRIIFEDNHLIILNKQVGEIVQGDKTGDEPLSEKLKTFIKLRDKKTGNVFLGVAHRLDRPVSGVIVFAKTGKALSRMNDIFKTGNVQKKYWAIVKNKPAESEQTLINYITRNEKTNKSFAYQKPIKDGKEAKLHYKTISQISNYFLLEIELFTGRHHQIRCQLAAIDCPIKGDLKYGAKRSNPDGGISLHARSISFTHPISKKEIVAVAETPTNDLWHFFEKK